MMFKPHLLTEICTLYGTGPLERAEVANKKRLADAYAGRLDHPSTPLNINSEIHMEVKVRVAPASSPCLQPVGWACDAALACIFTVWCLALLVSQWVAFVNDVGEGYMTFPPRGTGVELAPKKLYSESGGWEGH